MESHAILMAEVTGDAVFIAGNGIFERGIEHLYFGQLIEFWGCNQVARERVLLD